MQRKVPAFSKLRNDNRCSFFFLFRHRIRTSFVPEPRSLPFSSHPPSLPPFSTAWRLAKRLLFPLAVAEAGGESGLPPTSKGNAPPPPPRGGRKHKASRRESASRSAVCSFPAKTSKRTKKKKKRNWRAASGVTITSSPFHFFFVQVVRCACPTKKKKDENDMRNYFRFCSFYTEDRVNSFCFAVLTKPHLRKRDPEMLSGSLCRPF